MTLQLRPLTGLTLSASSTYSRTVGAADKLSLWPQLFGNFRAAYEFEPDGLTLAFAALYAHARKAFNDADLSLIGNPPVSDQLDLRLTLSAPVRALPGLGLRASVGAQVKPDQPSVVIAPSEATPERAIHFAHDRPQLQLLLGAKYDF